MERLAEMQFGGYTSSGLRRSALNSKLWLIVVPGNPGLVDFYDEFVDQLFDLCGGAHTVVALGHVGHRAGSSPILGLEEQIEHKAVFLRNCPADVSFILIGHSVGSYICLQVLKRNPALPIRKVVNLFPTIQHINEGLKPIVRWLMLPVFRHTLAFIAHWAPGWVKSYLLNIYEADMRAEDKARARALMCYSAVNSILYMAHCEATQICQLDESLLAPVQDRLVFLFAKHDRYTTPLDKFCHPLRERFPQMAVHVAEDAAIPHAFVQGYSAAVARLVHGYLTSTSPCPASPSPVMPPQKSEAMT